ncbi:MAG TPA: Rieske 2Fe-2S domain-containing protein [Aggregatilineales bacterium]|nr:Rieske 2Fe-2S domain-containing protein [Aggregatilineales bacterium]
MAVAQVADVALRAPGGTKASNSIEVKKVSRREFLNYLWAASLTALGTEACGAATWFALPSPLRNVPGGLFKYYPQMLPIVGASPAADLGGRIWLSNTPQGLLALSMVCTYRGCLVSWVPVNNRFECPCCGSKFTLAGRQIDGPAKRDLDRYVIRVTSSHGTIDTPSDGSPVSAKDASYVIVDERKKILGKPVNHSSL